MNTKTANKSFEQSFLAGVGSVLTQIAQDEGFRSRLTKGACTMAVAVSMAMGAAVQEAKAQDNGVVRLAKGTLGAVVGGALGSQIGKGSGKTAATVAGAAAGVWVAEELGGNANRPIMGNSNTNPGYGYGYGGSLGGPNVDYGPNGARTGDIYGGARTVSGRLPSAVARPGLNIGNTPLEADRHAKMKSLERQFLASRDDFARAQYAAEQAYDEVVLRPGNAAVQRASTDAQAHLQVAQRNYTGSRDEFTKVVEHFGARGYDVKSFAYSHTLAYTKVTSNDMNRRDLARAAQAAQDQYADRQNEIMGGPSYAGL